MQRRDFLKLCGAVGLGFAAPVGMSSLSYAQDARSEPPPHEGPYYVVFNASGGWDSTYLMDPKGVNGINRLYKEGDVLARGNHRLAPNAKHIQAGMSN
ncbi:MAG: twin-arginine translocation signal domain-containing protein, partial [Planctomycetales bacterium]